MVVRMSAGEKAGLAVLLTLGIALITLGVNLVREGQYEVGAVIVALGIVLLLIYFVFDEKMFVRLMKQ